MKKLWSWETIQRMKIKSLIASPFWSHFTKSSILFFQVATEKDFLDAINKVIKAYAKFSSTPKYMTYNWAFMTTNIHEKRPRIFGNFHTCFSIESNTSLLVKLIVNKFHSEVFLMSQVRLHFLLSFISNIKLIT